MQRDQSFVPKIQCLITKIISETNGLALNDTLELLFYDPTIKDDHMIEKAFIEFKKLLAGFQQDEVDISTLLEHPVSEALFKFFQDFPLKYHEEHIHLTGSLNAEFIYGHLKKLLSGKDGKAYNKKISEVYGKDSIPITCAKDVDNLIRLKEGELFSQYLRILYLPKLILTSKKMHEKAAFHMAEELYHKYNVGSIRLKFTLSRQTNIEIEKLPGKNQTTEEDVILGLYDGFMSFKKKFPDFNFVLSPCFRKESNFYDPNFSSKGAHFNAQVDQILTILEKFPFLRDYVLEVDTVGDEKEHYRKKHYEELKAGFRKLQYNGLRIRSHHGETWKILRTGVQSVDNALNIWHIDTLEHGLSLGINPNYYFHRLYQKVMAENKEGHPVPKTSQTYHELQDMRWLDSKVKTKLLTGKKLTPKEEKSFIKTKFHTAREVEHYQHDVLNRVIDKEVSLVALPSSNMKLTGCFPDYKDHPFSWWENKGVQLGVGTDNYITLGTNFIQEMLILLYSNPESLKITKLLMVATKESRRPFISHLLWEMRKKIMD